MNGRAKIHSEKQRLDDTFKRAAAVTDMELSADLARYLCVLVSGFLERAAVEILLEYTRLHSDPSVHKYVGSELNRFTNAKTQKLLDIFGRFDTNWHKDLTIHLVDERKAAVDSVVAIRHSIAHGTSVGVTMATAKRYYERVKEVVDHLADLCLPT
jgi:hypothetical protein